MTKEQIEQAVESDIFAFAVEIHNAAIEEAALLAERSWGARQTSENIRALKVEP